MRKRRVYLILAVGLVCVGVLVLMMRLDQEPDYQGKALSEWVAVYDSSNGRQGEGAIRAIGRSGLPYLIEWIGYERPRWKEQLNSVLENIGAPRFDYAEPEIDPYRAMGALQVLGPEAEAAIPELTRLLNRRCRGHSATLAAYALVSIGPLGMPPLLATLTNTQSRVTARIAAARPLLRTGTNATVLAPILRMWLADPDFLIRAWATNALSRATNGGYSTFREWK